MDKSTKAIYDENAESWSRAKPSILSDFTARPFVLEELIDLRGRHVLDLGCGEGYVARLVARHGARSVTGFDVSPEMIRQAREAVPRGEEDRFHFEAADVTKLGGAGRGAFERIMAVFLFNYLTVAETGEVLHLARQWIAPGGVFVFTVPHPCFPYMRSPTAPFFFETRGLDYFDGVDATYEGIIQRRDGTEVPVRCVHKTIGDYFELLAQSGWTCLPKVKELAVTAEHVALDPRFFGPLKGFPLHVLFRLEAAT